MLGLAAAAKSLQSCPTLGNPIDGSPLQALASYYYGAELPRCSTYFPTVVVFTLSALSTHRGFSASPLDISHI